MVRPGTEPVPVDACAVPPVGAAVDRVVEVEAYIVRNQSSTKKPRSKKCEPTRPDEESEDDSADVERAVPVLLEPWTVAACPAA